MLPVKRFPDSQPPSLEGISLRGRSNLNTNRLEAAEPYLPHIDTLNQDVFDGVRLLQTGKTCIQIVLEAMSDSPVRHPYSMLHCKPHKKLALHRRRAFPDTVRIREASAPLAKQLVGGASRVHSIFLPWPGEVIRYKGVTVHLVHPEPETYTLLQRIRAEFPPTSSTHLFSCIASSTVLEFFLRVLTILKIKGTICSTVHPSTHLSVQKRTLFPLPTLILERLLKTLAVFSSLSIGRPCHALLLSVLLSHSQRDLRASPCIFRFLTPSPP